MAFRPLGGGGWAGGRNYLWNLFYAVLTLPKREIQPILLAPSDEALPDLEPRGLEQVTPSGWLASPRAARLSLLSRFVLRRNPLEELWLRRVRADLSSHSAPLGRSPIPWIYWVYDLQHRVFPEFFSGFTRFVRERAMLEAFRDASLVIASSESTRDEVLRYYAGMVSPERIRVLRFVGQPRLDPARLPSLDELGTRLGVPNRYLYLPNQFWKHKNHALVVDALRINPEVVVIATGAAEDFRHPEYYGALMDRVRAWGLSDRFRHLGMVAFTDVMALMKHAVAVLNPSLFEGWSTSVEEARSLGKRTLLSDIPVHREQNPPRSAYFDPRDAEDLAQRMAGVWTTHNPNEDALSASEAASQLPHRTRDFGATYQSIALEAARRHAC